MLGFRLIVLLAALLVSLGIMPRGVVVTQVLAASSTSATSSDPVTLPTARPGNKDTKASGKTTSAKTDTKTGGGGGGKSDAKAISKASSKPAIKTGAASATKLSTEKPGHKTSPAIRGTLATGAMPLVPVSAAPGNVPLQPPPAMRLQPAVLPMAAATNVVDRAAGHHRRQAGDRSCRQEPFGRCDKC